MAPEQDNIIRKEKKRSRDELRQVRVGPSLGALLTGCGYMWRTIPPGYYDTDPRTRGDKVYETDEYGNVIRQKAVIVRDPSSGNDVVYETDKYGNVRGKKAVTAEKSDTEAG